jgi:hypothetical protein
MNNDTMSPEAIKFVEECFSNITDGKPVVYSNKHIPAVGKSCHRSGSEGNIAWDAILVKAYMQPTMNQSEKFPSGDINSLTLTSDFVPKKGEGANASLTTYLTGFGATPETVQQKIDKVIEGQKSVYDLFDKFNYGFRFYSESGMSFRNVKVEEVDDVSATLFVDNGRSLPISLTYRIDGDKKNIVVANCKADHRIMDIVPALEFQKKRFEQLKK